MHSTRGEIYITLVLISKGSGVLKGCIDAYYEVHPNIRGHTGGGLSMGRVFTIVTLTNQNIKTCSSTESDIFGVHNCMPAVFWTRYFMEAQGYQVMENIVLPRQQERHYP